MARRRNVTNVTLMREREALADTLEGANLGTVLETLDGHASTPMDRTERKVYRAALDRLRHLLRLPAGSPLRRLPDPPKTRRLVPPKRERRDDAFNVTADEFQSLWSDPK